ncbi:MAG TPA: aminotransferase class V-fold PLP-dependent enzyme [Longimicrobium sp.]|nr:aminotransferase class V-fold PLP-dependent enzyme [Longimicrobium sp.]
MLTCQRDLVHLPEGLHYLNCAYMGPLLKSVEEAGVAALRRRRDPTSITAPDFFTGADRARALFGELVNAPADRVSIVPSVSYAIATVAKNARLRRGTNVVVARGQFPSNVYSWRRMVDEGETDGAELRVVDAPGQPERRGEAWNARILEAIDEGTALVALGNVHWADGTRFDLEAIGRRAREVGALLVVDGTQSVGALPFDVDAVRPDVLVCAGYKWLLGPYSLGLAYFGERFDDAAPLEETWLGRRGSEDFARLVDYQDEYQPGGARFDVGERSNFTLMPMLIAALEQVLAWGPRNVQDYCRALTGELIEAARELGCVIEDEPWRGAHLFGIRTPPSIDAARLQRELAARRVSVSLRGDAVRVAPNVYNTPEDAAALIDALRAARG